MDASSVHLVILVQILTINYCCICLCLIVATEAPPTIPCGGTYTQAIGIIQSPQYSSPYPRNLECQWIVQAPQGYAIVLTVVAFDLEEGTSGVCFDALQVCNFPYSVIVESTMLIKSSWDTYAKMLY